MKTKNLFILLFAFWCSGCNDNKRGAEEEAQEEKERIGDGTCDPECPVGETCREGECECATDYTLCDGECLDLSEDDDNCGDCGNECKKKQYCDNGECVYEEKECESGLESCNGNCVDTSKNANHCGECSVACAKEQECVSGSCECPDGDMLCDDKCIDEQSDDDNCGKCGNACENGHFCSGGECVCQKGEEDCDGTCVDTQQSVDHCGECNNVCEGGRICDQGSCSCDANQELCENTCVDFATNAEHCGDCDTQCSDDQVCTDGVCTCPEGSTECEGVCVNVTDDPNNCGSCDRVCYEGEGCEQGECRGIAGADGCEDVPAENVSIAEVAAYQSIKIPLSSGQQPVGVDARPSKIIEGRETLFRISVNPENGGNPREISARVNLINDGQTDQYYAKKIVKVSSKDDNPESTFQVFVPPEKILVGTEYSVELVECTPDASGTAATTRFPVSETEPLGAIKSGSVKIVIIPILVNGLLPDTSEEGLEKYRAYMQSMYPANEIQITVGTQMQTGSPVNWNNMLDQLRRKRGTERPGMDIYYFGLVRPQNSFERYCRFGCTLGISYVAGLRDAAMRAAVGIDYGDRMSWETMAHELGHTHGRNHAPCAPGGMISGVDRAYPYDGAQTGHWGYSWTAKEFMGPVKSTDIMGYCENQWISDYTYNGLTQRVVGLNGTAKFDRTNAEDLSLFRVLILDGEGPRWGLPIEEPSAPFGEPVELTVLDQFGTDAIKVTGYRTEISSSSEKSSMVLVPEPDLDWFAVRFDGYQALEFEAPVSVPEL